MKTRYFLNTLTGETFIHTDREGSPLNAPYFTPFQYPRIGADGFTEVTHDLYVILDKVYAQGFVDGVQDEITTNECEGRVIKLEEYDYDRSDDFAFCKHGERPENCDFCNPQ